MKTIALTLLLLATSGCITARRQAQGTQELMNVKLLALACHNYASAFRKLPASLDDLGPFLDDDSLDLSKYELLYTGSLQADNPSETALLELREPLPNGQRPVAYLDGSAELITQ
jgi:hypothetical protein